MYMKKLLQLLLVGTLSLIGLNAQDDALPTEKVVFESTKTVSIRVDAKPIEGVVPRIDWGDGVLKDGAKNWSGMYAFNGTPTGKVTIYGSLVELDLCNFDAKNEVTSVEFTAQTKLETLNVNTNKLTELDLTKLPALKKLDAAKNELKVLDLSNLAVLEYVTAGNNKLTAVLMEGNAALKQLAVPHNELSTLPLTEELPALKSLDLEANAITSLDLSKLPVLSKLTINENGFTSLDLTLVPTLEKLYANGNYFTSIDLTKATELLNLSLNKNLLTVLDLSKNTKLTSVEVAENKLKKLDVSSIERLKTLNIEKNEEFAHIDIRKNTYLKTLKADDTSLAGLDATNNGSLDEVYLRGTRFSPAAFTQFFKTLTGLFWASYKPNIYLSRTSYKGADFSILEDKKFKTDLEEDTDTGEVVAPKACQLDLEVSQGGTAKLAIANDELTLPKAVEEGQVVYIDITPEEGYELASIKAEVTNEKGELVKLPVMTTAIVMEVNTKLFVSFRKEDSRRITLTTGAEKGTKASITLRQEEESFSDQIFVDWGNGQKLPYDVTKEQDTQTPIEGVISGESITIYGAVNKLMAAELSLTKADFSQNGSIKELDLYGNTLTELDLSNLLDLDVLNIAMNQLKAIDLSKNVNLRSATLYGNSEVGTLDVSNNKELVELFAKNLGLQTITLDLPKLEELDLHDNKLSEIDLSKVPELIILRLGWNKFKKFGEGVKLPKLKSLNIYHNELEEIDLNGFKALEWLFVQENPLKGIEIPKTLILLNKIHVEDCGLDVCQLNKFYESLPIWQESASGKDTEPVNLYNRGQGEKANQTDKSATSIAVVKGWTPAAVGDGTGCKKQAVEELSRGNGFNYYAEGNTCVVVLSPEYQNEVLTIFNLAGQKLYSSAGHLEHRVELSKGAYLITLKGKAFKFSL